MVKNTMLEKGKYNKWPKEKIKEDLEIQGYKPLTIVEKPNDYLKPHSHEESHILVVTDGEMKLKLDDKDEVILLSGDKLIIPPYVKHEVWFGPKGCTYLWVEY